MEDHHLMENHGSKGEGVEIFPAKPTFRGHGKFSGRTGPAEIEGRAWHPGDDCWGSPAIPQTGDVIASEFRIRTG